MLVLLVVLVVLVLVVVMALLLLVLVVGVAGVIPLEGSRASARAVVGLRLTKACGEWPGGSALSNARSPGGSATLDRGRAAVLA